MKINMEFNLPADNYSYQHAMNGAKYYEILEDFFKYLRQCDKNDINPDIFEVKKHLLELYADNNINPC